MVVGEGRLRAPVVASMGTGYQMPELSLRLWLRTGSSDFKDAARLGMNFCGGAAMDEGWFDEVDRKKVMRKCAVHSKSKVSSKLSDAARDSSTQFRAKKAKGAH